MKIDTLTSDFLETLLFVADNPDHDECPLEGATIYEFAPAFVSAVSDFVHGFRTYLAEHCPELYERCDECESSFGGNVFFSLSGHGCGFWDDRDSGLGDALQTALETFSGSRYRYRFEELESTLSRDEESGKIDLAFIPSALDEYRARYFRDGAAFVS